MFLIDIYKDSKYKLVIASSYKNTKVITEISKYNNISFDTLREQDDLHHLLESAHINALPTFQNTGIKLKLLNTLRQGKFVIANDPMIQKTGLETLCEKANSKAEFLSKTAKLLDQNFEGSFEKEREKLLENFDPDTSATKIIKLIFKN